MKVKQLNAGHLFGNKSISSQFNSTKGALSSKHNTLETTFTIADTQITTKQIGLSEDKGGNNIIFIFKYLLNTYDTL